MKPLLDYFYRFPNEYLRMRGRCRVRIYERDNGTHVVVLTELDTNSGESITSACDRIATSLAATRGLDPKRLDGYNTIPRTTSCRRYSMSCTSLGMARTQRRDPQWQRLGDDQVEAMTGDGLDALNRRLGDLESQIEGDNGHERTEAKGAA